MNIKVGDFGWQTARVFVDGVQADSVIEANEEKGWVRELVLHTTPTGHKIAKTNRERNAVAVRMRAGAVTVRMDPKVLLQMQLDKVLSP